MAASPSSRPTDRYQTRFSVSLDSMQISTTTSAVGSQLERIGVQNPAQQSNLYQLGSVQDTDPAATQNMQQSERSVQVDDLGAKTEQQTCVPWVRTVFAPYVLGLSERLWNLATRNGVHSWYSYSGKLKEKFSSHKEKLHESKSPNTVYSLSCLCGQRYIGETA